MRLKLKDAKIYTNEFVLAQPTFCSQQEIAIEEGYMDVDTTLISQECAKTEREKVWEMAKAINLAKEDGGMAYVELEDCFGTKNIARIMRSYSVDEALEKYESWKKINSSSTEEKVKAWWEMAGHILRMPSAERLKYFGISQALDIFSIPVNQALDMYESWRKANSVEELIKSLKPQDVVCIKARCCDNFVGMVTRVSLNASELKLDILHTNGEVDTIIFHENVEHIVKIGRVVETTDILGEIKKIEDEWRKKS